jgi:hypothetical protein
MFLTEVVHRRPQGWVNDVEQLHELLQAVGAQAMDRAFRTAVELGQYESAFIARVLGRPSVPTLPFFSEVRG